MGQDHWAGLVDLLMVEQAIWQEVISLNHLQIQILETGQMDPAGQVAADLAKTFAGQEDLYGQLEDNFQKIEDQKHKIERDKSRLSQDMADLIGHIQDQRQRLTQVLGHQDSRLRALFLAGRERQQRQNKAFRGQKQAFASYFRRNLPLESQLWDQKQ